MMRARRTSRGLIRAGGGSLKGILGILLVGMSIPANRARADGIRWVNAGANALVAQAAGYENAHLGAGFWEGRIGDPRDPIIELNPVEINADQTKYLYVKLAVESGDSLQVFFSQRGRFSEELSFRCRELVADATPAVYRFDLRQFKPWRGTIRFLRLDVDGADRGGAVRVYGAGVSEKPVGTVEGGAVVACAVPSQQRALYERMAAWHETMVATDERRPNSCVATYVKDRFTYGDSYSLAKIVVGVEVDGRANWPAGARGVRVEDLPGGVVSTYALGGRTVRVELVPLMVGRDTAEQDGAALLSVRSDPPAALLIRCGGSALNGFERPRTDWLRSDAVGEEGDTAEMADGTAVLRSTRHPFAVAVRTSGAISIGTGSQGGRFAMVRLDRGEGHLVVAFAKDVARAKQIAALDAKSARAAVERSYRHLLQCRIETPEQVMDAAFRSALYNLEYNWVKPYGWVECIHHWLALWHMQHTGAADWIGQTDRSRECILTLAGNLLPDGSVPQFVPGGSTRKDFGGSNQFFAWQVRHYWNSTGDRATIARVAPQLDRVIEQTFAEYDRDGDGLLAWGQQIGNQEDYVSTPFNGASPSVEGINMLRTGAMAARAVGDAKGAQAYEARAAQAAARLRAQLWQGDLGRFMFYQDPHGMVRADGQYHTLIYPVIWGLLDARDGWTSIRALRERLTGKDGETYCSNNFPNHTPCTCGPQAGAAQQPWAAWGLAAVGLRNETYLPLRAAARWAMNPDHRGSWPEVASEPTPAYFSPPAALFVQATIEALFGLEAHRPEGYLRAAPSFPDHWPAARLVLPEYSALYKRGRGALEYTVTSASPMARRLRWMLPPCRVSRLLVNGRAAAYRIIPGVQGVTLSADTGAATTTHFVVHYEPAAYRIEAPASVAEGDALSIRAQGCRIETIDDRCGMLASAGAAFGSEIRGVVAEGLLRPYAGYGRLGQMNFSRRTLFLSCAARGGVRFWAPVTLTILPRYECAQRGMAITPKGADLRLLVRNNTSSPLQGTGWLMALRQEFPLALRVPARSEREVTAAIPNAALALFSPGENRASVALPGGRAVDVTIVASRVFESLPRLAEYARRRLVHLPLPETALRPDAEWRQVREFYAYGHMPWAGSKPPLEGVGDDEVAVNGLPAVSFAPQGRRFVPVSWKSGQPEFRLDLGGEAYRKLYLLVIPFLDNHDTFSAVARVDVRTEDGGVVSRTLHFPGDLDWWCPEEVVGPYCTARKDRPDRFGLLRMLRPEQSDWEAAKPPDFPQPEFWATCLAVKTRSSVMNVIEMDLGRPAALRSLSISTLGIDPALGLVAVSGEKLGARELLEGTEWMPAPPLRDPTPVFGFTKQGDLAGWRTEGEAFSVAPVPSLFTVPTLNSLAKAGETATGRAISPNFTIGADDSRLRFIYQGGISLSDDGPGLVCLDLVDSTTGARLYRLLVKGSHLLRPGSIAVDPWRGRRVHLELVDANTNTSYAWLGIKEVSLTAGSELP